MTKLAPCPVCGQEPSYIRSVHVVTCGTAYGTHHLRVFGKTKREAIAAWNKAFKGIR